MDTPLTDKLNVVGTTPSPPRGSSRWTPLDVLRACPSTSRHVDCLVASWTPDRMPLAIRKRHRVPFIQPLWAIPLNDLFHAVGEPVLGQAQDLSIGGVSFWHKAAITTKHVALSFSSDQTDLPWIVTRLKWCRFKDDGTYVSGGLFVCTVWLSECFPQPKAEEVPTR